MEHEHPFSDDSEQAAPQDYPSRIAHLKDELRVLLPHLPTDVSQDPSFTTLMQDADGDVDAYVENQIRVFREHLKPGHEQFAERSIADDLSLMHGITELLIGEEESKRLIAEARISVPKQA